MATIYEKKVPAGQEFIFTDGTKVWNIQELGEKISIINDTEFHKYVNEEKNDFVNWLVYSLQNEELANIIAEIKSRPLMYLKIRQYILKNKSTTKEDTKVYKTKKIQQIFSKPKKEVEETKAEPIQEAVQELKEEIIQKNIKPPIQNIIPKTVTQQKKPTPQIKEEIIEQTKAKNEIATEFIVKEFIYGVVCGILIGLIVAKIIEILF